MKAVQFSEYGSPDVLELVEIDTPNVSSGEVRIKAAAIGVNPADFKWREGMFKEMVPLELPHIVGYDVAGVVDAVGDGVTAFSVGDRVCVILDPVKKGGYAEYCVCSEENVAPILDALDFDQAAALPTPSLTGFQLIDEQVKPEAGQRVLITGAVGAVGRCALFAARRAGAYVIAAVRASQEDEARALGASETIVLGGDEWNGAPFDHVADTIGGPAVAALCKHLKPGGRIRTVSTIPITAEGLPSEPAFVAVHPDPKALEEIARLSASGEIPTPIARRMPLAEAAEAHRLMEAGGVGGKIILKP